MNLKDILKKSPSTVNTTVVEDGEIKLATLTVSESKEEPTAKVVIDLEDAETVLTLYHTKNPDTGARYSIPGISPTDTDYIRNYAYYMSIRETNPELFKKIINWE